MHGDCLCCPACWRKLCRPERRNVGLIGLLATVVLGVAAIVITLRLRERKSFAWQVISDQPLLVGSVTDVRVLYKDVQLVAPRLVTVRMMNSGNKAIDGPDFGPEPLKVDVGRAELVSPSLLRHRGEMRDTPES